MLFLNNDQPKTSKLKRMHRSGSVSCLCWIYFLIPKDLNWRYSFSASATFPLILLMLHNMLSWSSTRIWLKRNNHGECWNENPKLSPESLESYFKTETTSKGLPLRTTHKTLERSSVFLLFIFKTLKSWGHWLSCLKVELSFSASKHLSQLCNVCGPCI